MANRDSLLDISRNASTASRGVKRTCSVLNDIKGTSEEISSDFCCPVCMDLILEAHMTQCGHTFCLSCLKRSIQVNKQCPICNFKINKINDIYPNRMVNQQVAKLNKKTKVLNSFEKHNRKSALGELKDYLSLELSYVNLNSITEMISMLQEKKTSLESKLPEMKFHLTKVFLSELKRHKEQDLKVLKKELSVIEQDLKTVAQFLDDVKNSDASFGLEKTSMPKDLTDSEDSTVTVISLPGPSDEALPLEEYFVVPVSVGSNKETSNFDSVVKRLHVQFDDLSNCYFKKCIPSLDDLDSGDKSHLIEFSDCISKFSQFSGLRHLATIDYASDKVHTANNIASSIEFDMDSEFFAVSGLTKKIRIFDYGTIIRDPVDTHYPCTDMACEAKISCVNWSSYFKSMLVSSDYDGRVTVWDVFADKKLHIYSEHQKRCWSVDFNKINTKLVASGSDDTYVKLWDLDVERSLQNIQAKANVCCVQFSPTSYYHLAFGSADHHIHYYDLRKTNEALKVFKGHNKAVSYVKFMSGDEIVSASTDSHLKVWNINDAKCIQSLQGHINDKNFVGLATDGEYIACGSENNSLYVYYKGLSKKLFNFSFDQRRNPLDQKEDEGSDFVSAVCWRKGSNIITAGNSHGIIKILELV